MGSPLTEDFSDNMNNIQSVQSDFMPSNADPIFDNLDTVTPQSSWAENAFETVSDTVAIDGIDSNVVSDVASVAATEKHASSVAAVGSKRRRVGRGPLPS